MLQARILTVPELDRKLEIGTLTLINTGATFRGHAIFLSAIDHGQRDRDSAVAYAKAMKKLGECDLNLLSKYGLIEL